MRHDPGVTEAYDLFQHGLGDLRAGRAAQATVSLEKAKRMEPDKASICEALAIAYFRLARWSEAETEFRTLVALQPTDDYAHRGLGRALQKQGRDAEAARFLALARCLAQPDPGTAREIRDELGDDF